MSDILLTEQTSASATPAAGRVVIYPKNDGYLYFKNDTGMETRVNPQTVATAAEWIAANTVLAAGVFGVASDTGNFKIGDGATAWNSLAYWRYTAEHITIATTGGNTNLTIPQSRASSMAVTGVLTSNVTITTPDTMALFVAENLTTGAFTVTFKTAAGSGIAIPQGGHATLYADGVSIENPVPSSTLVNVPAGNISATTVQAAINELDTEKVAVATRGVANGVATLDANALVPITQLPPAALERLVVVANQTARYALTTASIQNGDTVKQTDTGEMWYVVDDTNLGNSTGYTVYTAETASAVALSGVTGLGTGVATALAVAVGSAGAPVVNGGALGTPASGDLTNCTSNTEAANNNSTQLASTAYADRLTAGTLPGAFTTLSATGRVQDSVGNLALGTIGGGAQPVISNWGAVTRSIQIGEFAALVGNRSSGYASIANAAYQSTVTEATGWNYVATGIGVNLYQQQGGSHVWKYAAAGTADAQITWITQATLSSTGLAVTGTISATTTIKTGGYTVATLPAGTTGDRAYVTDATAPTYLGALTGGGAVVCPVFKNASAWVSA